MTEITFEARVRAIGLRPHPDDMPMLEALVNDLDRAAAHLRGPRLYAEEPLSTFRLEAGNNTDPLRCQLGRLAERP